MFCKQCGNKIDDDSRFCPVCGSEIQSKGYDNNTAISYAQPVYNQQSKNGNTNRPQKGKMHNPYQGQPLWKQIIKYWIIAVVVGGLGAFDILLLGDSIILMILGGVIIGIIVRPLFKLFEKW